MSTATNTIANAGETSRQGNNTSARPNPRAAEIPVTAAGSRPKAGGPGRELFSEDTETVLIFEDGAVIRLLATVTPGQLIFLTNLATKEEVVCEVLRKRLLRPAGCYVELQFTEQKKGFWGTLPAEAPTKGLGNAEPPRKSIETLVAQVQEVLAKKAGSTTQAPTAAAGATASKEANSPAGPASRATVETALPSQGQEKKVAPAQPNDSPDELLPKPELDFSKVPSEVNVKKLDPSLLRKPIPVIGAKTRKITWTMVLVIALGVGARYGHWLDFLTRPKSAGVTTSGQAVTATGTQPVTKSAVTKSDGEEKSPAAKSGAAITGAPGANGAAEKSKTVEEKARTENLEQAAARLNDSTLERAKQPATNGNAARKGKSETSSTVETEAPSRASEAVGEGPFVQAKLMRSVNPVYPPEAMKSFITGDVRAEVVVEPIGRVGEVKVVSGPTQLRAAAVDALRRYEFSPATRGGKAVPSKVMVTVKFWFNP